MVIFDLLALVKIVDLFRFRMQPVSTTRITGEHYCLITVFAKNFIVDPCSHDNCVSHCFLGYRYFTNRSDCKWQSSVEHEECERRKQKQEAYEKNAEQYHAYAHTKAILDLIRRLEKYIASGTTCDMLYRHALVFLMCVCSLFHKYVVRLEQARSSKKTNNKKNCANPIAKMRYVFWFKKYYDEQRTEHEKQGCKLESFVFKLEPCFTGWAPNSS